MEIDVEEYFLDVPWGQIAYVCSGRRDGKTVVMVHGNQDSASTFFPMLKYFPPEFRLIMIELPGCGKSSPFPPGQMLHHFDYVVSLKFVVDHLKLEHFILLAHSMGFQISLLFHAVYPDVITKFIAIDSVGFIPVNSQHFRPFFKVFYESFYENNNYKKFNAGPQLNPQYTYEEALDKITKARRLTRDAGEAVLKRSLLPIGDNEYRFSWDQRLKLIISPTFSEQYQLELFGNITIPHLTIFGSETVEANYKIMGRMNILQGFFKNPNFRMTIVNGNHDVHLNSPELVARHIIPFLQDNYESIDETQIHRDHFLELISTFNKSKL